jgi:hypothetical protein
MSIPTFQNEIAERLRSDPALMALLPGLVWTRRIRPNDGPPESPTPGSTPEAFDHAGRIRRCAAVLPGTGAVQNPLGPRGAYYAFPEIWLRCLPHESEKQKLEEIAGRIIARIEGVSVAAPGGAAAILTVAARMMPDDDPELAPAVVDMIRVQADGVWRWQE